MRNTTINTQMANFAIIEKTHDFILIKDIGPWDRYPTITNSVEEVVSSLARLLVNRKLYYIDSEGSQDEILVENGRFAGFRPGQGASNHG